MGDFIGDMVVIIGFILFVLFILGIVILLFGGL